MFESAVRAHENMGSQPVEDHAIIQDEYDHAKDQLMALLTKTAANPAMAVIHYILDEEGENNIDGDQDAMEFLRYWNEGEFEVLRNNWNNIPDDVFVGADPLFKPIQAE